MAGAPRVVIVGAGVAGLAAALDLAARGVDVTLIERAPAPGGKMRELAAGPARIDAGPTVLTMRWVFEELFRAAGAELDAHVPMERAEVLARHAWSERERLDLYSDVERTTDAIGRFAGSADATGYRAFAARAQQVYEALEHSFIRAARPSPVDLVRAAGWRGLPELWRISPFQSLAASLRGCFRDARLQQLFGRYATYCGSSPFLAPATLMLIAHVERTGVWLVEGGMHRLARAMAGVAAKAGAEIRYGEEVRSVRASGGRATGVLLAGGETIAADAVIVNGDAAAVAAGLFGLEASRAVPAVGPRARSLSAITWTMLARCRGFSLLRHNVFFSASEAGEFTTLFTGARVPDEPTVYLCAQDRGGGDESAACEAGGAGGRRAAERLLCLINAPAIGDRYHFGPEELERCKRKIFRRLQHCGLTLQEEEDTTRVTTPEDFDRLFPATGGALYGTATHGWKASFQRPGSRTGMPGLYLAGGSVHPGAGVPMAALSGRQAARAVAAQFASTTRSRTTVTHGGIAMR